MKKTVWLVLLCALCMLAPCALAVTIGGCAYVDENANALCDEGELLITGVPVTLARHNGTAWEAAAEGVTDEYGFYAFDSMEPGEYRVLSPLNDPAYCVAAIGDIPFFENGSVYLDVDAQEEIHADVALQAASFLQVSAYQDADSNGVRGNYEEALDKVLVEVLSSDQVIASGLTNRKGNLTLMVLPGTHTVRFTLPDNYAFTVTGKHSSAAGDEGSALSEPISFVAGETAEAFAAARPVGSFHGMAYEDVNNNGVLDADEPGVAGVTIHLEGKKNGTKRSITTDETGLYDFERLPSDTYIVTADLPGAMLYARYSKEGGDLRSIFTGETTVREFAVKAGKSVESKHVGVIQKGAIVGLAFLDLNYNGRLDEGEPGYEGVTLEAIKHSNAESRGKGVSQKDGSYRVENLRSAEYRLRAILPDDGSIFTVTAEGSPAEVNRFEQRGTRREFTVQTITLASGEEAYALVGVAVGASVSGTVFEDADYNGRLNGKEKTISGLNVKAVNANGEVVSEDTTDKKGQYTLEGLMPGSYIIQVERKANYGFTRLRPEEKGGSFVTVLQGEYGVTNPVTVAMGEAVAGVNAGMLPSAKVSGSFFHDANDNGLWDKEELGMQSAQVRLLSDDGEFDLYTQPAEDGSYFFDGVMPGKYTLSYLLPEHCEMAQTVKDGNTVAHSGLETATAPFSIKMGKDHEMPLAGAVTLGSFVGGFYSDSNASGLCEANESMLSGAKLVFTSASGKTTEAVADENGAFHVSGLRPDEYTLSITLPEGYIFSASTEELALNPVHEQTMPLTWQMLINRSEKAIGAVRPASIAGEIWMDENKDGLQAQDEWLLEGLTVNLLNEADGSLYSSCLSGENGFLFENVRPGIYTVQFDLPQQSSPAQDAASTFRLNGAGMEQTSVTVTEGENRTGLATGLVSRTSIGGTALLEENGVQSPVAGVTVTLYLDGQAIASAETAEDGSYRFDGLWPGEYHLRASVPAGIIFVRPNDPDYPLGASFVADASTGESASFFLYMAQHQLDRNALYIKAAKVGDQAWLDENRNGLLDGGEPFLPGVEVALVQNGETVYKTMTDAYGYYLFADVYPGEYTLTASAYAEVAPTQPVPSLRIISSCLTSGDGANAQSESFRVESGETNFNCDLGYVLLDGAQLPSDVLTAPDGRDWSISNAPKE